MKKKGKVNIYEEQLMNRPSTRYQNPSAKSSMNKSASLKVFSSLKNQSIGKQDTLNPRATITYYKIIFFMVIDYQLLYLLEI